MQVGVQKSVTVQYINLDVAWFVMWPRLLLAGAKRLPTFTPGMARLNKPFVLIDESVVMHGFRTLMSGAALDDFKANPIMLYQHNRSVQYGDQDSILPIGKWVDIEVQGDKLVAYPEFDDDDDFAKRIEKKVEKGYLNGASIWLHPMAVSDEDTLKLPGQSGPTVTKWGVLEASIVLVEE